MTKSLAAAGLGGSDTAMVGRSVALVLGQASMMNSVGKSTKVGPGRPYHATRYAVRMASTIDDGSRADGRMQVLVCGVSKATASSSWKPPLVTEMDSDDPPNTISGNAFAEAFPIYHNP